MNFTLAELTRLNLEPGEVLAVKLYGDDYDETDLGGLQKNLQEMFPNNKVAMFVLPVGKDLQFEVLNGKLENKTDKVLTEEQVEHSKQKDALIEHLESFSKTAGEQYKASYPNGFPTKDCNTSYCEDCNCGKKAMAEANDDISKRES